MEEAKLYCSLISDFRLYNCIGGNFNFTASDSVGALHDKEYETKRVEQKNSVHTQTA